MARGVLATGQFGPRAPAVGRLRVCLGGAGSPSGLCPEQRDSSQALGLRDRGFQPSCYADKHDRLWRGLPSSTPATQTSTPPHPPKWLQVAQMSEAIGGEERRPEAAAGLTECALSGPAGPVFPSSLCPGSPESRAGLASSPFPASHGGAAEAPAQSANYVVFKIHFRE